MGHVGFYRRFIKDFFEIAKPLSNLVFKERLLSLMISVCKRSCFEREIGINTYCSSTGLESSF